MTTIIISLALLSPIKETTKPQPLPEYPLAGYASYYGHSPTVATLDYRLAAEDITHKHVEFADVFVAVADCGRMGERGYITINDSEPLPYVVFDCANRSDDTANWMIDNNIAVELDYFTTTKYVPEHDGAWVELEVVYHD